MAQEKSILQDLTDVQIKRLLLFSSTTTSNPGGAIDLMPITVEINCYEDIFSNCMNGNLVISDSTHFNNADSWHGEEYLLMEFSKVQNVQTSRSANFSKIFKVFALTNREFSNETNEMYVLNFCSEEFLLNQKIRISKTYKNKRISQIIKDIALNYLKIDPKEFPDSNIEETYGTYNITIPNLKPLQAINWLCTLAISNKLPKNKQSGATYLFWQTKEGYFFKSILGIFNDEKNIYNGPGQPKGFIESLDGGTSKYWYGIKNVELENSIGDKNYNDALRTNQIFSYKNLNSYNTLDAIGKGIFSNKSIGLDIISKSVYTNSFNHKEYFGNKTSNGYLNNILLYKKKGKFSILSDVKDRFGKTLDQYNNGTIRWGLTTTGQNENKYIKANQHDIKDYNIEHTSIYRTTQFCLLSYNRFSITISGDPELTVGKIIYVSIPQMVVQQNKKINPENKFLSGYYIITALRHMINMTNEYLTVIEIRKDSYYATDTDSEFGGNGIPSADNNNETFNKLKRKNTI